MRILARVEMIAILAAVASHVSAAVFYNFESGTQGWSGGKGMKFQQASVGATMGKHSLKIGNYRGTFVWIGSEDSSGETLRALRSAKQVFFDLTFTSDVTLKKDANGNRWFTFVAAEQGEDFKWRQGKNYGIVPLSGNVVRAGTYTIALDLRGIMQPDGKKLRFSIGPGTSGLGKPITFYVDSFRTTRPLASQAYSKMRRANIAR